MRALEPEVVNTVWEAVKHLIPQPDDNHPLGCHRRRVPDRICFEGILIRLILGCSWQTGSSDFRGESPRGVGPSWVCLRRGVLGSGSW